MQGQHEMRRRCHLGVEDRAGDEPHLALGAERRRERGVACPLVLADVDADDLDVETAPGQVAVGGEGQVGVAAAEVDHPQRARQLVVGRQRRGEGAEESVDLATFGRVAADLRGTAGRRGRAGAPSRGRVRRPGRRWRHRRRGAPARRPSWSPAPARSPRPPRRASCRTARPAGRRPPPPRPDPVPRSGCTDGRRRWSRSAAGGPTSGKPGAAPPVRPRGSTRAGARPRPRGSGAGSSSRSRTSASAAVRSSGIRFPGSRRRRGPRGRPGPARPPPRPRRHGRAVRAAVRR